MFFLLRTFKFMLLCGLVVTIYLPKNSCQIPGVGRFWIWVVFYCSLLFILSALIGSQQVWVSVPVVSIGFCNSLEYVPCAYLEYVPCAYLPNCLTYLIIDSLAADKKAHKKCWCLFRVCNVAVNLVFLLPEQLASFLPFFVLFFMFSGKVVATQKLLFGWEHAYSLLRQLFVFWFSIFPKKIAS